MQYITVQCSTTKTTLKYSAAQRSAVHHSTLQYNKNNPEVQCSTEKCSTSQYIAVHKKWPCSTVQYIAEECRILKVALQYSAVHCKMVPHGAVHACGNCRSQRNAVHHIAAQCSAAQRSAMPCRVVPCSAAQCTLKPPVEEPSQQTCSRWSDMQSTVNRHARSSEQTCTQQ